MADAYLQQLDLVVTAAGTDLVPISDDPAGTGRLKAITVDDLFASFDAGVTDHGALTGLGDDDHSQYALLAGRSGGQTIVGGTASGDDLTLRSTSHATKGDVLIASGVRVPDARNIDLLDATSNAVTFGTAGVADPTAGSAGMKIQLYGNTRGTFSTSDFAIGVGPSNLWFNAIGDISFYSTGAKRFGTTADGLNVPAVLSFAGAGSPSPPGSGVTGRRVALYITDDYSIGIDTFVVWYASGGSHVWYGASFVEKMRVDGDGHLSLAGAFRPTSMADASAPNNSLYYSTTASKLVYKDGAGLVSALY